MKSLIIFIAIAIFIAFLGKSLASKLRFNDDVPLVSVGSITSGIVKARIDFDYGTEILKAREMNNSLVWLMRNIGSEVVESYIANQFFLGDIPKKVQVHTAITEGTAGATKDIKLMTANQARSCQVGALINAIGVAPGSGCTIDFRVTAVTGDTITVEPNNPAKKINALDADTYLFLRSNSYAQNALSVDPINPIYDKVSNPTQIFRTPFGSSDTVDNERMFGGESERSLRRQNAEIRHLEGIEYAYLLNPEQVIIESSVTSGVHRGVLLGIIPDLLATMATYNNVHQYSGTLDLANFRSTILRICKRKYVDGNQKKRVMLHNAAMSDFIWELNENNVMQTTKDTIFGHECDLLKFAGADIVPIEHPLLDDYYDDFTKPMGLIIHPRYLKEKVMKNRSTRLRANIQPRDQDGYKDEFLTESTIIMALKEMHGLIIPN